LFACGSISIVITVASFIRQKTEFVKEVEKRQQLEIEFQKKVQTASKLEHDYLLLRQQYVKEIEVLREELSDIHVDKAELIKNEFQNIIYSTSSSMLKILTEMKSIGETDAPVLIQGESGTGKELIAKAIHEKSKRSKKPFVIINCSAIPETLFESEVFGHVKGAFTGANNDKTGFFEAANGGTIFLDEISELSFVMQAKLLRILQSGTFYRVGSTKEQKVDVRIVAASNQIFERLIEQGKFRQDLFYRLNVLSVQVPPLRDRLDDIPVLLHHFFGKRKVQITSLAMKVLQTYHWPGNVRELKNIATRICLSDDLPIVTAKWLQRHLKMRNQIPVKAFFADEILELLRQLKFRNDANVIIAKKLGNLHRSTITEYLRGMTFQFFSEENFNLTKAARKFNPLPDDQSDKKLQNKMNRYIKNLIDKIDFSMAWEKNKQEIKKHIRKLPKQYHSAAMTTAKAYWRGLWKI
jgi:transcriptional regulator with PAS, ATPase and Fis domain